MKHNPQIRAFEKAVEQTEQKQVCSASASQQLVGRASAIKELSEPDLAFLGSMMEGLAWLGIDLNGEYESNGRFLIIQARFSEVSVVVKITCELDAAFCELLAREGEFGMQLFPQLLPFDENWVSGADTDMDVLQIPCN